MRNKILTIMVFALVGIFLTGCADQKTPLRVASKPFAGKRDSRRDGSPAC